MNLQIRELLRQYVEGEAGFYAAIDELNEARRLTGGRVPIAKQLALLERSRAHSDRGMAAVRQLQQLGLSDPEIDRLADQLR